MSKLAANFPGRATPPPDPPHIWACWGRPHGGYHPRGYCGFPLERKIFFKLFSDLMDPWMDPWMDPSNRKESKFCFFVPKEIHYTPTGDNPHAARPSRPRWGVSPYIGRSSPGQPQEVPHLHHFLTFFSDHASDWF